ncbi:hypothetical protein R3P38DRAFT_2716743 [Favolaschia claudopus]|uniref:C3H1-type domain-containing protein n=1 Tax=Favolaschia claudopus TaxID=2862362 RepID=A0AAW0AYJ9_9AGAR
MSANDSPDTPTPDHDAGDDNGDAIVDVVLTPDTATLEKALAERAAKRQSIAAQKHQSATEKQAFGVTLMKIKNYEAAAGCFAEACRLWRGNPVARCDLATALLHLGKFVDAEKQASTALNLDPKLVEARYARAMARKGRGNLRGAIVDFQTVLELAPDNVSAQTALQDLQAEQTAAATAASTSASEPAPSSAPLEDAPPSAETSNPPADDAAAPSPPPAATTEDAGAGLDDSAFLANPLPISTPLRTSEIFDDDSASDTSDALHTARGTPCLFYNTSSCKRGTLCAFSHAPDRRSVRDGLGKNVCLYWLVGLCKFGPKCIYKHGREALGAGWDKERGKGAAEEGAGAGAAGAEGAPNHINNEKSKNGNHNNNQRHKGKQPQGRKGPPPPRTAAEHNASVLASVSAQHAALAAELARRMALFNMTMGISPYESYAVGMPQTVGVVGHGHGISQPMMGVDSTSGIAAGAGPEAVVVAPENASAGFTEYVPPPRAAEASEAEGAGAGLSY